MAISVGRNHWLLLIIALAIGESVAWQGSIENTFHDNGDNSKLLLCLGLGRVGQACARLALPHFDSVVGTVNPWPSSTIPDEVEQIPWQASAVRPYLNRATHILWTLPTRLPPPTAGGTVSQDVSSVHDVWKELSFQGRPWVGMISTTAVYGHHDGAWVTELSPCQPNVDTYQAWEHAFTPLGAHIFRSAGIYDSQSSALHTVYRKGRPPPTAEEFVTNRIHVEDLARAVVACMLQDPLPSIYNLVDNEPALRSQVLNYAADLLESAGVILPSMAPADSRTSPRQQRRGADHKRVDNQKLKRLLQGQPLLYPTYRQGLQDILYDPTTPWHHLLT